MRDTRQGLTCHAAALTSHNFVLGTQHERSNDTTSSATLKLVNDMFSPSRATADLNRFRVNIDRGCW